MNKVIITQINDKFVIKTQDHKVYILTKRMLKWNLKHTFNLKGDDILAIMVAIGMNNFSSIVVDAA